MIVLGFDPSLTNFGWAVHDTQAVGPARCLARGRFQTGASMSFIERYMFLRDEVTNLIQTVKPDRCGSESPVFHELYSEGLYGLFLFYMEALYKSKSDVVLFSPMQVKAHARESAKFPSKWKMEKPEMVIAAKDDTKTKVKWDHNEADAYLVARLSGRFWDYEVGNLQPSDLTPVEKDQFTYTHTYTRGKKAGKTVKSGLVFREDQRFFRWSQLKNP